MSSKMIDTRTRILDAAWQLLEADPRKGARMGDIAKATGISRQAVYLHFASRTELLIALTHYIDDVKNVDARLIESRSTTVGADRLVAFVGAWGNYIPEIYGVAKALLVMKDTDTAADSAWNDRMQAVRHGCAAVVHALQDDGTLTPELTVDTATDMLWTLLSVRNWEHLRQDCGWSQSEYIARVTTMAAHMLIGKG